MDLRTDHHVHTLFSVGSATVDENVRAAERAGLAGLVILDRADPASDWLAAHASVLRRAAARTGLTVSRGLEVAVLDTGGRLALPADLSGVDYLAVTDAGFPLRSGPATPADVRVLLGTGMLTAPLLGELLVKATVAGLCRAAEIAQPLLVKPLSILGAVGLRSDALPAELLAALAAGCLASGAVVEVSERRRCPPLAVARVLAAAGVPLVAGSSARHPAEVGNWSYAADLARELAG